MTPRLRNPINTVRNGSRYRIVAVAVAALALITSAAPASAASPPTETVTCREVITHSLTLGNDLSCLGRELTIGANDITLDLGGHTLFLRI